MKLVVFFRSEDVTAVRLALLCSQKTSGVVLIGSALGV